MAVNLLIRTTQLEMAAEDWAYWMGKFVMEASKVDSTKCKLNILYTASVSLKYAP